MKTNIKGKGGSMCNSRFAEEEKDIDMKILKRNMERQKQSEEKEKGIIIKKLGYDPKENFCILTDGTSDSEKEFLEQAEDWWLALDENISRKDKEQE